MSQHFIMYGDRKIPFTLVQTDRKTVETRVLPDMSVEVRAPIDLEMDRIMELVAKRGRWIVKKQQSFQHYDRIIPEKRYVSGETHRYLGRQYRLKLIESNERKVRLKGRFIMIWTPNKRDTELTKRLLEKWYREHAYAKFNKLIDDAMLKVGKYGIARPELRIKKMEKRWGSCLEEKEVIFLNLQLVKVPVHCVEYVILHEMVHLMYPNHGEHFHYLLSAILPDWIKRKQQLEEMEI